MFQITDITSSVITADIVSWDGTDWDNVVEADVTLRPATDSSENYYIVSSTHLVTGFKTGDDYFAISNTNRRLYLCT